MRHIIVELIIIDWINTLPRYHTRIIDQYLFSFSTNIEKKNVNFLCRHFLNSQKHPTDSHILFQKKKFTARPSTHFFRRAESNEKSNFRFFLFIFFELLLILFTISKGFFGHFLRGHLKRCAMFWIGFLYSWVFLCDS